MKKEEKPLLKFCGLRRQEDILWANELLPDYIGFVFASSPRQLTVEQAKKLAVQLDPCIKKVGVFVNESSKKLAQIVEQVQLDVVQLHGDEDDFKIRMARSFLPASVRLWKAVRVRTQKEIFAAEQLDVDALLLDAFAQKSYGGTGKTLDWTLLKGLRLKKPFFLAGGLTAENLRQMLSLLDPDGVDISSGIETDGIKDYQKMKAVAQLLRKEYCHE